NETGRFVEGQFGFRAGATRAASRYQAAHRIQRAISGAGECVFSHGRRTDSILGENRRLAAVGSEVLQYVEWRSVSCTLFGREYDLRRQAAGAKSVGPFN